MNPSRPSIRLSAGIRPHASNPPRPASTRKGSAALGADSRIVVGCALEAQPMNAQMTPDNIRRDLLVNQVLWYLDRLPAEYVIGFCDGVIKRLPRPPEPEKARWNPVVDGDWRARMRDPKMAHLRVVRPARQRRQTAVEAAPQEQTGRTEA
jgi:hypothetical protein